MELYTNILEEISSFDRVLETALLLDLYGPLLTERQRSMLQMRYEEDLTLSEISSLTGISRQAAQDAITRGERQLIETEELLGILRREKEQQASLEKCINLLTGMDGNAAEAQRILEALLAREGYGEPVGI